MIATPPPVICLPAEAPWHPPVKPCVITSRFGPRPPPYGPLHPGVDLHAPTGTEVHAVDDGVIARSYGACRYWPPGADASVVVPERTTVPAATVTGAGCVDTPCVETQVREVLGPQMDPACR